MPENKCLTSNRAGIVVPMVDFNRCEVVSDGLACFGRVTDAGCTHQVITTGADAARMPVFKRVNTALGNIKAALTGTYRATEPSTCRTTSPSSSIASTADTTSPP